MAVNARAAGAHHSREMRKGPPPYVCTLAPAAQLFYWMIDAAERVLEAFKLVDGMWTRIGSYDGPAIARVAPFEDVELEPCYRPRRRVERPGQHQSI